MREQQVLRDPATRSAQSRFVGALIAIDIWRTARTPDEEMRGRLSQLQRDRT